MSTRETADDVQDARERGDIYAHMLAAEIREREDRERRAAEDIGELQRENIRLVERLQEVVRERDALYQANTEARAHPDDLRVLHECLKRLRATEDGMQHPMKVVLEILRGMEPQDALRFRLPNRVPRHAR